MTYRLILFSIGLLLLGLVRATAQSPVIFHSSETALPGDVFGIQGDNFGSAPQVWLHLVTGSEGSLSPTVGTTQLAVLNSTNTEISTVIPATETAGLYAVWVNNSGTWAGPVFLNQARSWGAPDLASTSIDPNRSFRLFGRNLYLSGSNPAVNFVSDSGSLPATVTNVGSDSYHLTVQAPAGLVPGTTYTIQLTNGFGGSYGQTFMTSAPLTTAPGGSAPTPPTELTAVAVGSDPFGLEVPWGSDSTFTTLATHVWNIQTGASSNPNDPPLPSASTLPLSMWSNGSVIDNSSAINNAIQWISNQPQGGVLYLPTGTYCVFGSNDTNYTAIVLYSKVVLKGDGPSATTIKLQSYSNPFTFSTMVETAFGIQSHVGVINIGFEDDILPEEGGGTNPSYYFSNSDHVFAINAQFTTSTDRGNVGWSNVNQMVVRNCNISGSAAGSYPSDCNADQNVIFTCNTCPYYENRYAFTGCVRGLVENNTITRFTGATGTYETHGFDISETQQFALLNNTINKSGSGDLPTGNNDGETILSQGEYSSTPSTVTSAGPRTLTDSSQDWPSQDFTVAAGYNWLAQFPNRSIYVAIVGGVGAGQIRQITNNTCNTLTVDHPWDEIPGAGSIYSVELLQNDRVVMESNHLSNNVASIEFAYASLLDVAIANNTMTNNGGIILAPLADTVLSSNPPESNTIMDTVVNGNQITQDSSDTYSQSQGNALPFIGISFIDGNQLGETVSYITEFRDNSVTVPVSGAEAGVGGYELVADWVGGVNCGAIFQGNSATNATDAYTLSPGDLDTVIWNPVDTNVVNGLLDVDEGAVNTVYNGPEVYTVPIGSSELIGKLQYSDSFNFGTGSSGTRNGESYPAQEYPLTAAEAEAENSYGNPSRSWDPNAFSLANSANLTATEDSPAPMLVGADQKSGFTQTGVGNDTFPIPYEADFGIKYGLSQDFVVQTDAVQTSDRVDISIGDTNDTIFSSDGLSVFFRSQGNSVTVGLWNASKNETDTTLVSGLTLNTWNNYAVEFNVAANALKIYTNQRLLGVINLNTFAGGKYAGVLDSSSNQYAIIGGHVNGTGEYGIIWTDNFEIGLPANSVAVGNSLLIQTLQYSDTFTFGGGGSGSRNGESYPSQFFPLSPAVAEVEATYGNPSQSWDTDAFSIANAASLTATESSPYPSLSAGGQLTGFTQTGLGNWDSPIPGEADFGIGDGLSQDFVVQTDAVQCSDRVDISIGDTNDTIFSSDGLSVFFRPQGSSIEVGLWNASEGEANTSFSSGVAVNTWNNYAVEFNVSANTLKIYTNQKLLGTIDLNTFDEGAYAHVLDSSSNQYVIIGGHLSGSGNDVGILWTDNFQVGTP